MGIMLRMRTRPASIAPCLPTKTDKLPSGSQWLHEIKHDGFRIIARKTGAHVGTMVSVVGVNGYAPGIRDRSGCDPLRHSRRVGVGIERCALYATDNQESEPRGIKNPLFRCVIVSVPAFCHWSERTPLGPSCGANFQGGYIMLKILTALAASLAMLSAAAAADLPRREPPPPAPAPVGKYPVGKAPIGKYPPPPPVVTNG